MQRRYGSTFEPHNEAIKSVWRWINRRLACHSRASRLGADAGLPLSFVEKFGFENALGMSRVVVDADWPEHIRVALGSC
jgi:hypothetical protein